MNIKENTKRKEKKNLEAYPEYSTSKIIINPVKMGLQVT